MVCKQFAPDFPARAHETRNPPLAEANVSGVTTVVPALKIVAR